METKRKERARVCSGLMSTCYFVREGAEGGGTGSKELTQKYIDRNSREELLHANGFAQTSTSKPGRAKVPVQQGWQSITPDRGNTPRKGIIFLNKEYYALSY